jgi:uncharacterized protein YvpB
MLKKKFLALLTLTFLLGCGAVEDADKRKKVSEEKAVTENTDLKPQETGINEFSIAAVIPQDEEDKIEPLKMEKEETDSSETKGEEEKIIEDAKQPEYTTEPYKDIVQISKNAANIRQGPHTSYPSIISYSKNTKLEVYEKAIVDGFIWYHVKSDGGIDGWISASVVEKYKAKPDYVTEKIDKELEIAVPVGNVRKGPGTDYDVITSLQAYTKLDAIEKTELDGQTWYHVKFSNGSGWVSSTIVEDYNPNRKMVLIDAPHIRQLPELPRGCEVTSLAMLLGHAGVNVNKMTLAKEIKRDPTPYEQKDGKIFFGNPYDGFVGDMYSFDNPGLGVYHGPIAALGEKYLPGRIVDLTGKNFNAVYQQLDKGKPVWVIVTSTYAYLPESYWQTWHTPSGKVKVTKKEHSVLVTGYDDKYIYFNDPLAGKNRKVSKANFIAGWEQIGKQAISYN